MKWFVSLLALLMALSLPHAGWASDSGLTSAPYKPPKLGTRIEYSKWGCTVESVVGLKTNCRLDSGGLISLLGWFEIEGDIPLQSYFADRLVFYHDIYKGLVLKVSLSEKDRNAIAGLWPLKVGKKVNYSSRLKIEFVGAELGVNEEHPGDTVSLARVESTELVAIGGSNVQTFVIAIDTRLRANTVAGVSRQETARRLWYSPELGLVVKEEFEWTKGPRQGRRFVSVLRSVQLPGGTPNQLSPEGLEEAEPRHDAPSMSTSTKDRLSSIGDLLEEGLITKDEASEKRRQILEDL